MKWFKHYENAHTNNFIQALLMEKNGHELYACYFLLLELLCKEFQKDTTCYTVSVEQLSKAFHVKYSKKSERLLKDLVEFSARFDRDLLNVEQISEKFYKIETPIMSELIGKSFKRTRQGRSKDAPKNKNKNKNKNIPQETAGAAGAVEMVAEDWNILCEVLKIEDNIKLPSVKTPLSEARRKRVKIMLKDLPDREQWKKAMGMIPANKFNIGQNDRGWVANFDWFLNSKQNYLKLYEAWCLANED